MYISELDLHGFKSFAHKTSVKFDSGITAIVGPNGCGKSNIVDALRWVLGEQRPTLLRSTSMSNVIFNGTAKKKALGMAEVSLTLVNNRGLLPTEYNEVTITRRLYRSGDSDYLINNTACRLKDIMELFMDTGMGSDAYSVIELKMVEEILNDRNNDRRRLFEEAAGVTRYKEKRKQTLRKLDETLSDLQRVEDILVEVRKKSRSLEIQAQKAKQAKEFRVELESIDKAYNRHEYDKIHEEIAPLKERIERAETEKREIESGVQTLESREEVARKRLLEKEQTESELRKRANQLDHTLRDLETTLRITKEKIENEKGVIVRYKEDMEQSETDLRELTDLKQQNQDRLQKLARDFDRSEQSLQASRDRFNEVQQQYTQIRHQLYELEIESGDTDKKLNELRTDRVRLESRLENTEGDLQRIDNDVKDLKKEIDILHGEESLLAKRLKSLRNEEAETDETLEVATAKRKELESRREELREEVRSLKSKHDALNSEQKLLSEMADSKDFFPSSVAWLTEHYADEFELLEIAGEVFHTDEEHAAALEAALGEAIHYVIVANMDEAVRASELLKQHDQGRATFVPLSELKTDTEIKKHSILGVVELEDQRFMPLARLLLGSVILAEDLGRARRLLEVGGTTAVTTQGEWITTQRFLRSGSKSRQAGVRLSLRDKIEKLETELARTRSTLAKRESTLESLQQELNSLDLESLRKTQRDKQSEIRKQEQAASRIQSNIQVYKKNIGDLQERRKSLMTNEGTAKDKLDDLNPREDELREKIDELTTLQESKKEELKKLEEERSIAQNRYNDARLSHQDIKNQRENLEKEIKRAATGIESIRERFNSRKEMSEKSAQRIKEHERAVLESEGSIEEKRGQKTELDKALEEAEAECSQERGQIREIEQELKQLRQKKEVNLELHHHLQMAREKLDMQAQSLSDHIWETYGILMKQIKDTLPEELTPEEAKSRIGQLKQKLHQIGDVNPLAIEEHKEESERLHFLEEQMEDLLNAEEQLRETIDEINETATERFNKTFEQIRTNFISVFGTLFEEDDYCDLLIDQENEDPLEARIEIKANPRGKRPSGINQLSGGEKTLTAIALLFAIYLVKPSPFCVLDEVDAPLDDANIERFANMIRNFSNQTQFIIITHNKKTMSKAEMMYGVTMPETGVSRLVGVKLDEAASA